MTPFIRGKGLHKDVTDWRGGVVVRASALKMSNERQSKKVENEQTNERHVIIIKNYLSFH